MGAEWAIVLTLSGIKKKKLKFETTSNHKICITSSHLWCPLCFSVKGWSWPPSEEAGSPRLSMCMVTLDRAEEAGRSPGAVVRERRTPVL
jgi:hypothetical protein